MVPKMMSLIEIKSDTNGFNHNKIIGKRASAFVYEGVIPSFGSVGVKRFNHENILESSVSRIPFNTEFATMAGCLRHKNLVQIQGWCCDRNELVLVYGIPSVNTDIYSFGVVVLEVVSGKRPVDEERVVISDYVWDVWEKGISSEGADCSLMGQFDLAEIDRALMVGLCCVHPDCATRPTVREAVRMLRGECLLSVFSVRKPKLRFESVVGMEGFDEMLSCGGDLGENNPSSSSSPLQTLFIIPTRRIGP